MTKKDSELTATTTFAKTDIVAVTTGMPTTPVTKHVLADDFSKQMDAWRSETVIIEVYGFEEEPALGVIEGLSFSMPANYTMVGVPSLSIQDEQGGAGSTSGPFILRILKNGTTIHTTNITIDQGELNTSTAATPPVISDSALNAFDQYTFEVMDEGVGVIGPMLLMFEIRKA